MIPDRKGVSAKTSGRAELWKWLVGARVTAWEADELKPEEANRA